MNVHAAPCTSNANALESCITTQSYTMTPLHCPPPPECMNFQALVPIGMYAGLAKYARLHQISMADAVYSCVSYALPLVEQGDDFQISPLALHPNQKQPCVRIPLEMYARLMAQAKRMTYIDDHGAPIPCGSRASVLKLCIRKGLAAARLPDYDPDEPLAIVPNAPRKLQVLDSLILVPLPGSVQLWLKERGTLSAQVRAAIDAELPAVQADATITRGTARQPVGAAGWSSVGVRISTEQHEQLRDAAAQLSIPAVQVARICLLKYIARRVAAQKYAQSTQAPSPTPQLEGAPA